MRVAYKFIYSEIRQVEQGIKQDLYIFIYFWQRDKMKITLQNDNYDTKLESVDWRSSAAILGLLQYFNYHNFEYVIEDDYILYNSSNIKEEKYLEFVEHKYGQELHHKAIESILANEEINDVQIKLVNDKLVANTIMKKYFNKVKFDNTNKKYILDIIEKNRLEIIRETFRSKKICMQIMLIQINCLRVNKNIVDF